MFQKVLCLILSVTTLLGIFSVSVLAAVSDDQDYVESNNTTASTKEEMTALVGIPTYEEYLEKHYGLPQNQSEEISVNILDFIASPGKDGVDAAAPVDQHNMCVGYADPDDINWKGFTAEDAKSSVYLPDFGEVSWNVEIPTGKAGYYYLRFEYYACNTKESSVSAIERKLEIGAAAPFKEASQIVFDKTWSFNYGDDSVEDVLVEKNTIMPDGQWITYETRDDGYFKVVTTVTGGDKYRREYKIAQDINGNSMQPQAIQTPTWNTIYSKDASGYNDGYFKFYFNDTAVYSITLAAEREPMIIKSITLVPASTEEHQIQTYEEYLAQAKKDGYDTGKGNVVRLEAEFPDMVSDSSVYATNDNSSSASYPSSPNSQLYNVIGENSYSAVGQWAAYKFRVTEKGLYRIGLRYLQNQLEGMYICRSIKIASNDSKYGATPINPFLEAQDIQFGYSKEWISSFASDGKSDSFLFALDPGVEYTLYLECSLGIQLKDVISDVEDILNTLNSYYLRILQLTGSSPDEYRDYGFMNIMPDVVIGFLEQADRLEAVKNSLVELCGTMGSHVATLETIYKLLDTMGTDYGDNVAGNLSNFKSYLGTLGTWINNSKKGTLYLDTITICPANFNEEELPEAKAGFFSSMWFEITSFIYSFFTDYESMGLTKDPSEGASGGTIDVWLASGRDQSNIWRTMIDAEKGFSDKTGYGVALKLVTGGTLLPSILAAKGPDVYMGLGASEVINYAIREAVIGINGNDTRYFNEKNENLEDNKVFTTTNYIYKDSDGNFYYSKQDALDAGKTEDDIYVSFTSLPFDQVEADNYVTAATDTLELGDVVYGVPQTM
ncbi:MAG: hypothetical protein IKV16_02420, partial [Clostridia bacterium]|nr:hypothetical protein [Clostridia bacterium]